MIVTGKTDSAKGINGPAQQGGWSRWSSEAPSKLSHSVIVWIKWLQSHLPLVVCALFIGTELVCSTRAGHRMRLKDDEREEGRWNVMGRTRAGRKTWRKPGKYSRARSRPGVPAGLEPPPRQGIESYHAQPKEPLGYSRPPLKDIETEE